MTRMHESMAQSCVLAPQAVPTATLKASAFVDGSNVAEVAFAIATGALASGNKVTVELYTSQVPAGTGAVKAGEAVFTAEGAMESAMVLASYRVRADGGRYVGVKFKHDAGADVLSSVTASVAVRELPAQNGWTLVG